MDLGKLARLPCSAQDGWPQIFARPPSVPTTFLSILLPLSLLAPAMLAYAGHHHPQAYLLDPAQLALQSVAVLTFFAELTSVVVMARVIQVVGTTFDKAIRFRDAFLVATIVVIPMYLSSFGLLVPSLAWLVCFLLAGSLISGATLFQGMTFILRINNSLLMHELSAQVFATGALIWALFGVIVLVGAPF